MSDPELQVRAGEEVTCEEVLTFLWAYLAGELPPVKVEEFERHLAICSSCVAYLETYQQTVELSRGSVRAEDREEELPEDLVRAVMAARRKG
jgi:predicted anti-sigma-YlaC factor YlaD